MAASYEEEVDESTTMEDEVLDPSMVEDGEQIEILNKFRFKDPKPITTYQLGVPNRSS
ncbi:hypothetical protein COLO4_05005 [Corchorus olitorius]|uniref:Uncharacterized protein n=1 Tax=Corchorus olitorius TaxID=93759 RepID=A0A1R3KS69_9ROSI|nr:hypothetical protein COLO4_05005 [Corchorus olitorius]